MGAEQQLDEVIQADGLCIITGMEYATPEGDFLIFGPFDLLPEGLPAKELMSLVDRVDGVAVAAHPFRAGRNTSPEIIAQKLCRIVEGKNGRDNGIGLKTIANWQKKYDVRLVGGSDAHSLEELGRTITVFNQPIRSKREFIHALKYGSYQPETNPLAAG